MKIAVNVNHLNDEILSFFGFNLVWEDLGENRFKVYRDKYQEDHIVSKDKPYVFVDNDFDADAMRAVNRIRFDTPRTT